MADAPEVRVRVVCPERIHIEDAFGVHACGGRRCDGTGFETRTLTGLDALAVDAARKEVAYSRAFRALRGYTGGLHNDRYHALAQALGDATRAMNEASAKLKAALLAEGGKDG